MVILLRNAAGAVAAFGLLLSIPAFGQSASGTSSVETEDDSITVTGRRPATRSEVSRQADQITPRNGNPRRNPLARFEKPVCPGVIGMPEAWAEHLVGRVRHVAGLVGMDVAPENACDPNVLVVFVPSARDGLAQVEKVFPDMFRRMSLQERERLREDTGAVRVVTASVERTRDGFDVPPRTGSGSPPVVSVPLAFSRIFLTTREDIESVILLIEARAAGGMSVVQLADYVAMRSFAETRHPPEDVLAMDTILTLFEPGASAPQSLTDFDLAYLRSLYDGIPNMPATTRTLGLNRQLRRMEQDGTGIAEPDLTETGEGE
ncbi:MAG TPA: hypothetical protein VNR60_11175 [Croceibacterium sp.]|nr:hypothetical protein [Croceibacterium sp.]